MSAPGVVHTVQPRSKGDIRRPRKGELDPRFVRGQAFKELQAHWYAKLKKTKFNDDGKPDPKGEPFRDLDPKNKADNRNALLLNEDWGGRANGKRFRRYVTLPAEQAEQDLEVQLAANARTFGTITNLADTPTARAWQAISRAANDLPPDYRHRVFLIDLAQTGVVASYLLRRHKLREGEARGVFKRFLLAHGMGDFQGLLVRGPVRER